MPSFIASLLGAAAGAGAGFFLSRKRRATATADEPRQERDGEPYYSDAGRRLAEVAHELNNPLTAILAFAQDLLQADPSPEQREALLVIQQQARRSRKLVRGLLEQVRATPPDMPQIKPSELVARVVPVFERDAARNGLRFNAGADPGLPLLEGDASGLEQVLTNLLQNAFQATPRGGAVTLITRVRGRLLEFVVEDSGPGIPADHLPRIFDPYFTSKAPGEGTGLGLSVSQTIVRRHRGTLVAENIPPWEGGGARFIVSLPFVDRRQRDREMTEEMPLPSNGRRALLIEDDEAVRLSMQRFLARNGWQVHEAHDGLAGLELALREAWDVIVCDVNLPGLSGLELFDRLQANDPDRIRNVLLVTGDSRAAPVVEFRKRTGATILEKPFELADFRRAVDQAAGPPPPDDS